MQHLLYRGLTWASWTVALPWLAWKRRRGGREWRERLGELPRSRGSLWVHAASVGEVAAATPLVRALMEAGETVVLTVLTPTGRRAAEDLAGEGAIVAFPPLDLPPAVRSALDAISPRAILIIETELWPNMLLEATVRRIPVSIVNGRLSLESVRRYGNLFFPLASVRASVSLVACRSEADRARFAELGFEGDRLEVTGSTKFDVLSATPSDSERAAMREELGLGADVPVIVMGSVRPKEEKQVLDAVPGLLGGSSVQIILAPRHLERIENLSRGLASRGVSFRLRSEPGARGERVGVILLDSTGELSRVYSVADVAFVGGTLAPYGGHNPLEPAAAGVPVVLGPHTSSCAYEANLLVERRAALRVSDGPQLENALLSLLSDDAERGRMAGAALEAVSSGRGATRRTLDLLRARGLLGSRTAGDQ